MKHLFQLAVLFALWLSPLAPATLASAHTDAAPAPSPAHPAEAGPQESPFGPIVRQAERADVSPPLRDIPPRPPLPGPARELPTLPLPKARGQVNATTPDPVVQDWMGLPLMPTPIINVDGLSNSDNQSVLGFMVWPPDTNGDVGPNHYVQWVNLVFAIWNKSGTMVYGPAAGNTLWSGFGGPCESSNDGDIITLYDEQAGRWLMSQFALPNFPSGPFYQCIAISQTNDPTGSWYRYQFLISNTKLNDYPKFGVWPDAYYMAINQFTAPSFNWGGQGAVAFERAKMLVGDPTAQMVYFDLFSVNPCFGGQLPSDMDGYLPPPGSPNYYMEVDDDAWGCFSPPTDSLRLWRFHVDWTNPANSTFGVNGQPNATLNVASWNSMPCVLIGSRDCIPQPGVPTTQYLDAIGDRLMYRLQYRNFGTYQALVTNHTVDAGGGRAGIRWYEIRDPGGTPTIFQQGTYAPADTEHRWMGSIAMDRQGNMALGFSVSSSTVYPSIRYVGRLAADPPGTLPQGETTLIAGTGSQTTTNSRWGDYSMMGVDALDGCTFWYTQEYYAQTGNVWRTRIGSFRFPECTAPTSVELVNFNAAPPAVPQVALWMLGLGAGAVLTGLALRTLLRRRA